MEKVLRAFGWGRNRRSESVLTRIARQRRNTVFLDETVAPTNIFMYRTNAIAERLKRQKVV
jgi:hypothetical protein